MARKLSKDAESMQPICWAIDPLRDDIPYHRRALAVLAPLARAMKSKIAPVCFIDRFRPLHEKSYFFPLLPVLETPSDEYRAIAEARFRKISSNRYRDVLLPIHFLTHKRSAAPSLGEISSTLSEHAQSQRAPLVAVHSHTHEGLARLYRGSFAETFLFDNHLPTLTLSSKVRVASRVRTIVFPTDFSPESRHAFRQLLPLAARLRAKIHLAHFSSALTPAFWGILAPKWNKEIERFAASEERRTKKESRFFVQLAKAHKVQIEVVPLVDRRHIYPSEAVLAYARKIKSSLIALASKSGPLRSAVLGATTREIMRGAECAVLIYRGARSR